MVALPATKPELLPQTVPAMVVFMPSFKTEAFATEVFIEFNNPILPDDEIDGDVLMATGRKIGTFAADVEYA